MGCSPHTRLPNCLRGGFSDHLVYMCMLSWVWLFVTPKTVAHQAPLSMGFSRQELLKWVALPFSRGSFWPRDSTHLSCTAGKFFTSWAIEVSLITRIKWLIYFLAPVYHLLVLELTGTYHFRKGQISYSHTELFHRSAWEMEVLHSYFWRTDPQGYTV